MSGDSLSRLPRPSFTALMNCWWTSAMSTLACCTSFGSTGENGSSMPLFSPAVMRRRSTPSLSMSPVKPKPFISTPIEPTMLALAT